MNWEFVTELLCTLGVGAICQIQSLSAMIKKYDVWGGGRVDVYDNRIRSCRCQKNFASRSIACPSPCLIDSRRVSVTGRFR